MPDKPKLQPKPVNLPSTNGSYITNNNQAKFISKRVADKILKHTDSPVEFDSLDNLIKPYVVVD